MIKIKFTNPEDEELLEDTLYDDGYTIYFKFKNITNIIFIPNSTTGGNIKTSDYINIHNCCNKPTRRLLINSFFTGYVKDVTKSSEIFGYKKVKQTFKDLPLSELEVQFENDFHSKKLDTTVNTVLLRKADPYSWYRFLIEDIGIKITNCNVKEKLKQYVLEQSNKINKGSICKIKNSGVICKVLNIESKNIITKKFENRKVLYADILIDNKKDIIQLNKLKLIKNE
jgi:hypothetical protein